MGGTGSSHPAAEHAQHTESLRLRMQPELSSKAGLYLGPSGLWKACVPWSWLC